MESALLIRLVGNFTRRRSPKNRGILSLFGASAYSTEEKVGRIPSAWICEGSSSCKAVGSYRRLSTDAKLKDRSTDEASDKTESSSVSPGEVEKFEKLSSFWWNPDSPMKELQSMNKLRVPLIRDGLVGGRTDLNSIRESPTPLSGIRLLDIGCGGGILSEPLGKLGATVVGVDPGQENIRIADGHLTPELRNRVSYECTTLENFITTNSEPLFDAVIMSEVIEHVENPEAFVQLASQLIKENGSLFITTLNRTLESWAGAIVAWEYILRKLPIGTHSWKKFITPQEMESSLRRSGFRIKLVHGMSYNPATNRWKWSKSTSINYSIHAVKETVK